MREIVADVYMMERILGANVYLLHSNKGSTLVDSGIVADADRILTQISQAGYDAANIDSIVVTHLHGDHAGGAPKLAQRLGAQVMAHREDAPYISRTTSIPAFASLTNLINWFDNNVVLRHPACKVDRLLEEGDKIDALEGCIIIHTPGHTAGSICIYQPDRQILFCGDALFNSNPLTQKPRLSLPFRIITLDNAEALESVYKLARLPIKVICFGHGKPILDGAGAQLKAFLDKHQSKP